MGDISRIDASQAIEITDGVSQSAAVMTSAPAGSEGGLIVRNIPSGIQPVSGTVTLSSNTVTLSSQTVTVGNNPSVTLVATTVTQPVSGTVTHVPSGTQTVSGTVAIGNSSIATLNHNIKSFTTTAIQMTTISTAASYGVIVKALNVNTASVYVGGSSVTTSNGYELSSGENISLPINNANVIYLIAASGTQTVCWVSV